MRCASLLLLLTSLAHADASLPPASQPGVKRFVTRWPAVLPCARFSSLRMLANAGSEVHWRGAGADLGWTIPPHRPNEPGVVVTLHDFPAHTLRVAEIAGSDGFDVTLTCDDHDAVGFSCFPSPCVTVASYPARAPIDLHDALRTDASARAAVAARARQWVVALVDTICGERCTRQAHTAVADLRGDDGWVVVKTTIEDHRWRVDYRRGGTRFAVTCNLFDAPPEVACALSRPSLYALIGKSIEMIEPRGELSLSAERLLVSGAALRLR